jgi:hypothetical protein
MSVKFCIAYGATKISLTCGMDGRSESADLSSFRLSELGRPKYKTYTPEMIRKRIEVAQSMPDDTRNIWRNRIICTLAAVESVFCISFIPKDPSQLQILQVMRMKDVNEIADSYRVYYCDYSPYKFMMPKESPDQVFDLARCNISQTVEHLESDSLIPILTKALGYLIQDKDLGGLVITFENLRTYIWLKGK